MIDKQGKSVYRLDGKRTTLNEISSLLTELGIDVDGHNIVTQGDITKIVNNINNLYHFFFFINNKIYFLKKD